MNSSPASTATAANSYTFLYDQVNRLLAYGHSVAPSITSTSWSTPSRIFDESAIYYNLNGNIVTLTRRGMHTTSGSTSLLTDILIYSYTGNRLTTLSHNNATGSVRAAGSYGYTYDANGNMTKNSREGLDYACNYLNLLGNVKSGSTVKAQYRWLADGTKASVRNGTTGTNGYEYLGSLVYKRTGTASFALESAGFGGGRIVKTTSGYEANYQITDHLGSVRVVFKDKSNVLARNDFYAFSKRHVNSSLAAGTDDLNRFLYNGKEKLITGAVGFLDYGARMYDPEIGRWFNVDPMAEERQWMSPFAYVSNNPANRTDPTGMLDDWYQFDWYSGEYLRTLERDGEHMMMISNSETGKYSLHEFADPINDPMAIDNGDITNFVSVTDDQISGILNDSGADVRSNKLNLSNLARNSKGGGDFDYYSSAKINGDILRDNTLFVVKNPNGTSVAHNSYNFGNFLWGATVSSMNIPLSIGLVGAHVHNYIYDPQNTGIEWNKRVLDSHDDQYSIGLGYMWQRAERRKK